MLHLISEHKSKNVLFQCLLGKSNLQVLKWKGGNLRVRGDDVKRFFGNWFESEPFLAKTFLPRAGKVAIRCTEMPRSGSYNSRIGWLKIQIFSGCLLLIFWFVNLNWNIFSCCFEGKSYFVVTLSTWCIVSVRSGLTQRITGFLWLSAGSVFQATRTRSDPHPQHPQAGPVPQCSAKLCIQPSLLCRYDSANFWRTNVIFV